MNSSLYQKSHKSDHGQTASVNEMANAIYGSCILVVDDELSRKFISQVLIREGYQSLHFVAEDQDVMTAVEQLRPDLIILDWTDPNVNDTDICQNIRTHDVLHDIPIIIHTADNSPQMRARIITAGATDIFPKPVTDVELKSRVHLHLEFRIMVKGLQDYHKRLTRDLEIARSMQYALLPEEKLLQEIAEKHHIDIAHKYETSDELGGDFWGVDILDEDRIFIYVTDFAGHGVSAAMNTFRLHSLVTHYDDVVSPADYLEKLNRILFKLLPVEQYATMLCGIIDVKKDNFTYAAAASTAPLLSVMGSRDVTLLDPSGFPLGMIADATYETREIPFSKGEMLFLYSDVLTESKDQLGRMIGEEKFLEMCEDTCLNISAKDKFLDRFMRLFNMHVVKPLQDDLTAVTFIRR